MATKKTISDIDTAGKTVLVRVDFNVPLDGGSITDDKRIRSALPTIEALIRGGAKVVLMSHLGRPKGQVRPEFSLRPVAERLGELLGKTVKLGPVEIVGRETAKLVGEMSPGDVVLLENVRFDARETSKDESECMELGEEIGSLGEVYVNDAFGTCHRRHASMYGAAKAIRAAGGPAVAGLLVEKEIKYLHQAVSDPKRPFVAILGGAKVSDKITLISTLLEKVEKILIGGAMAYTLLKAKGASVGKSLVEEDRVAEMKDLLDKAGEKVMLPCDHLATDDFENGGPVAVDGTDIPDGLMGMDIGEATIDAYRKVIAPAGTIVWNGPMGVFERQAYAAGTQAVARAVAEATDRGAVTVIGGGDSAAAVEQMGLSDRMTHVSTGGGASLTYLEGKPMGPIDVLDDK